MRTQWQGAGGGAVRVARWRVQMSHFLASEAAIERLISMTAGSESAEIYIYIQAVIPQLVNNEVITLSAADVNSLKRSCSPKS
jgi:hypothetical protein